MTEIANNLDNEKIYSNSPLVKTQLSVLSNEECEHFINISKKSLKQSLVSDAKQGIISKGRSGRNTWIRHKHDEITQEVGERIAKIVGLPLENAEAFQIIYYGVSQEYRQHYDSWDHDGSEKTLRCMKRGGARLKTALCYLNDVKKGGGTKMTKLNITIPPIKGSLLIFDNTYSITNHTRHPLSEHAGLPVEEGVKYAFNLWFKECNHERLYQDYNPEYYKNIEIKNKYINTETNTSLSSSQLDINCILNKDNLDINYSLNNKLPIQTVSLNTPDTNENSNHQLPETLQIGDYIPFIKVQREGGTKEIHNFCNEKPFMFVAINDVTSEDLDSLLLNMTNSFNVIVLFHEGKPQNIRNNILYSKDNQLSVLLRIDDVPRVYISSPNRRIVSILTCKELSELHKLNLEIYTPTQVHIPYILIEDALDEPLLRKVIDFYNQKKVEGKLTTHNHATKNRCHVHPDSELERQIDHKLSRSVLPELKKVFYFDAQYRETYKICSYDSESSGRFHPHRDTPAPYQHRKFALSLFLNDDYEGGEFVLCEYGLKIKPKANTAFIFPGISTHQILPVTKGSRMTIITFFVNGSLRPQYKMKAHFYKDKNIVESDIYPL